LHDQCENHGRREKRGEKKFIGDKLCHHWPHILPEKKDFITKFPMTQWKEDFGHQTCCRRLRAPSTWNIYIYIYIYSFLTDLIIKKKLLWKYKKSLNVSFNFFSRAFWLLHCVF
jgi:hypothetical protein